MTRPAHDAPNAKKDSTMIRLPRTARPRRALVAFLLSAALLIPAGVALAHATQDAAEAAPDPTSDSSYEVVTLARGAEKTGEPIAMAVLPDRRVLHTSRDGRVWMTNPDATTTLAGTVPVYSHDEDGLQGIAVDDHFEQNRWVYLYFAPPLDTPAGDAPHDGTGPETFEPYEGRNLLARVQLTVDGTLDFSTQQDILTVPANRGTCCHAGGEIDFDAEGNLYLSTGDDTDPFNQDGFTPIDERTTRNPAFDAQRSSANTNDLRGKLLRITVHEDGSYTIPSGNLFDEASDADDKTRPEIYAMGFRNPFRFAIDRETGWAFLGDYGPDASASDPNRGPGGQVEFNLIKEPGNYGWPYCHGKNAAYNDFDFGTGISGAKFDCQNPVNESPRNTGLTSLPPSVPATVAYDNCSAPPTFGCGSESPMGGPTYHYDAANPFETKFPEHFDDKQFAYEFGRGWIRALTFTPEGELGTVEPIMDSFDFRQLISVEFGPDGSLYVLDYGTGFFSGDENSAVYRIDYVQGTRSPVAVANADQTSGPAPLGVQFSSEGTNDPDGGAVSYAWDFTSDGTIDSTEANPSFSYTDPGRYTAKLTVTDDTGKTGFASVNLVAGNTAPTVSFELPQQGNIFDYGMSFPWKVSVTDPEDGTVDCADVVVNTSQGHNDHAHGHLSATGCEGTFTVSERWEPKEQHSFYVLTASYTDTSTPGLELTGTAEVVLEERTQQAEFFDAQQGLQLLSGEGAAGGERVGYVDAGDWLRFDDLNLSGIDQVQARVSSWANSGFELRADAPDGQLLASVPVSSTGGGDSYQTQSPVAVADPGGTFDLYVVFTAGSMDLDEFTLLGAGVSANHRPVIDVTATPASGTVPLTVDFEGSITDPEGEALDIAWDFTSDGTTDATVATPSHIYPERGEYTATVTVTDAAGQTSVRTFPIVVSPDCPTEAPGPSDSFDGTAPDGTGLDHCRWSTVVREDRSHYRVANGALEIDAVDGDLYGANTSAKNLILQPAPEGAWEAVTKLTFPQGEEWEQAGMVARSSDLDFAKAVLIDVPGQGWRVDFAQQRGGQPRFDESLDRSGALPENVEADGIWLKMRSNGVGLSAAWSADGEGWTSVGRTVPLGELADPKIGLAAYNGNGQAARFDSFDVDTDVPLACQEPAAPADGYRMLFDGTGASLAEWKMAGPGSFVLQDDCSILSVGGLGLLYHPEELESYSLQLDWKQAGDDNAGVFVGFQDPGTDPFQAVNQGHEIQIDSTDDFDSTTGAVYNIQAAEIAVRDAVLNPPGEWNHYEIIVTLDRIQVLLNGVKVNDFTNTDSIRMNPPSLIGLQNHGIDDDVYFRNVQVKDLPTPTGSTPRISITAPAAGTLATTDTTTVTGTASGSRVELRNGRWRVEATPDENDVFTAEVPLALGTNRILATTYDDNGLTAATQTTVVAQLFGEQLGGFDDPAGDDNGPGTYVYPANSAFAPGGFDLAGLDVYVDGDQAKFVATVNGNLVNPWGGDDISHQRVNVYLGAPGGSGPQAALTGTNMDTATPWSRAIVIDGRFQTAGVYDAAGNKLVGADVFSVGQTRQIGVSVPLSALGGLDLGSALYGTAMFGNGEIGDGHGYVRPVYDRAYWENPGADLWWITEYRFGGGLGVWENTPDRDTDTRDPNAIDVVVGEGQQQSQVLTWNGQTTRIPMLTLQGEGGGGPGDGPTDTTAPETVATVTPAEPDGEAGWYASDPQIVLDATDDSGTVSFTVARVDGAAWYMVDGPITVADGDHTVEFRSGDEAGNIEPIRSISLKADRAAPVTTATYDVEGTTATVELVADDLTSGVAATQVKVGDSEWTAYTAPFPVDVRWGAVELSFRSTDVAGNVEETRNATVGRAELPDPQLELDPAAVPVGGSVEVTGSDFVAGDEVSVRLVGTADGVAATVAGDGTLTATLPIAEGTPLGQTEVEVVLGATRLAAAALEVLAPAAPTVSLAVDPAAPTGANGWWTGPVSAAVAAEGLGAEAQVRVAAAGTDIGAVDWQATTKPLAIDDDGEWLVQARAVNEYGGESAVAEAVIRIDAAVPVSVGIRDGRMVTVTATDETSGVVTTEYSLDGGDTWDAVTGPIALSDAGGTVMHRATDAAGNVSTVGEVVVPAAEPGSITINGKLLAGKAATVKGVGFRPGVLVAIRFDDELVKEVVTDHRGRFSASIAVPADASGAHTVSAVMGEEIVDEVAVTVKG